MQITDKKQLISGVNCTDSEILLGPGDYLNLENFRVGSSEFGKEGRLENIPGTILLFSSLPVNGFNRTIGRTTDTARQRIIFFNYNSTNKHGIYAYDKRSGVTYTVLLQDDIEGGLNFDPNFWIHSVAVFGDLLIWTDNNNQPKKVNIEAGIKTYQPGYVTTQSPYALPIKKTTLTVIKRPPIFRLEVVKTSEGSNPNNYTKDYTFFFAYRYKYRDNEYSALSSYSDMVPYNTAAEVFNAVDVSLPTSEKIDDDVSQIDICVKYGNFGKTFVVKSFKKTIDGAAISAHNAGTPLKFRFLNNTGGIALDSVSSVNNFDLVPIISKTLSIAKNRLYFGNNKSGYNTPDSTSLSVSVTNTNTGSSGSFSGQWGYIVLHANFDHDPDVQDSYMFPFVKATGAPHTFYYFPNARVSTIWNGGTFIPDLKATENLSDATISADDETTFINALKFSNYPANPSGLHIGFPVWKTPYDKIENAFGTSSAMTLLSYSAINLTSFFKSGGTYNVSISFYDEYRRKCGIVNTQTRVTIPDRTYTQTTFTTSLTWLLSNTNALVEIPDWAYYYQIHISKNLKTRFFVQAISKSASYVNKNNDGTFTYGNTSFTVDRYAASIDISPLLSFGLGYTFQEGDLVNIYKSDGSPAFTNLPILGVNGNNLHFKSVPLGVLDGTTKTMFELFTPYIPQATEDLYETGPVYQVASPGTTQRSYSVLTDVIKGDVFALQRSLDGSTNYLVETMSPNDTYWKDWQTNTGWSNKVDEIGQVTGTSNIVFSDKYLAGTRVNGLNKFQALNTQETFAENGPIQRLELANKQQQEDGSVMLCICDDGPISIYLGETQLVSNTGNAFVAQAVGVIGTLNALKGNFGTQHPESVYEYLGEMNWYDVVNGVYVRYADNGVFPISDYKMIRYFSRYSKKYLNDGTDVVQQRNGFYQVTTCVDPLHKEVLVSMPAPEDPGFCGLLPGYTGVPSYTNSIDNRYDFYDGKAKTVSFNMRKDRWKGSYGYVSDCMIHLGMELYGFKDGKLYKHNSDTTNYNTFYGVKYPPRICFVENADPSLVKSLHGIAVEGNVAPTFTHIYSDYPYKQSSDLIARDYDTLEGKFYGRVKKDRLSPGVSSFEQGLIAGQKVRASVPKIMAEFAIYDKPIYIDFLNVRFRISAGHKV